MAEDGQRWIWTGSRPESDDTEAAPGAASPGSLQWATTEWSVLTYDMESMRKLGASNIQNIGSSRVTGTLGVRYVALDAVVRTDDDAMPPVILTAGSEPDAGSNEPDEEKEPTWRQEIGRGYDWALENAREALGLVLTALGFLNPPQLTPLHGSDTLSKSTLDYWRGKSTEDIVKSLLSPGAEKLTIRPNGTVLQGNHRVSVLLERGYDTSKLFTKATIIPKTPIGPLP